ncbi:Gpi18-like mannosyltransferase [Actinoplanes lutulentus]|uniref:glycosyltransferase 87 family protein n=1 Tax=Actinoplanes lutulentus TaxID=1287878 RepID=UPI0011B93A52|nr:glycosyltransferase 87 family protein [Actinoplanes lutulentus]MBB2942298.1 Gpi18-like mannosyltransferase [Actinoplanes lutulentus]
MTRLRANLPATLLVGALLVIAAGVRWAGRDQLTYDMLVFIRWYHQLEAAGGIHGMDRQIGNYNAPYLYLLLLTTYLPGSLILKIKAVYVVFDLLLAWFAYRTVALRRPGHPAVAAGLIVLMLPTVTINAAFWGQIDSMWASFAVGGLYFLLRGKPVWAVSFCAIAFAFKPQGVFIFPLLLVCVLAGRIRWRALLAGPIVFVLLDVPAMLLGRDPFELLTMYEPSRQAKYTTTALNAHAPNIFAFFGVDQLSATWYDQESRVEALRLLGYGFTAALVLGICYLTVARRVRLDAVRLVTLAAFFAILVPYTLPSMHERYFYLGDVLTVVLVFYRPRLWYVPLLVQTASLGSYTPSLLGFHSLSMVPLAVIMGAAVLVLGHTVITDALRAQPPAGWFRGGHSEPVSRRREDRREPLPAHQA